MSLKQFSSESILVFFIALLVSLYFIGKRIDEINRPKDCGGSGNVEVFLEPISAIPEKKPVSLIDSKSKILLTRKELICLATNIYQEAKFETHVGKIAVAHVTYNRLKSGKWGSDICSVVYSKKQFSWTLNKNLREEIPSGKPWDKSLFAAKQFIEGKRVSNLSQSQFYHADYIKKPRWAFKMEETTKIGHHIFYVSAE